jgi:hypothetical protein
MGRQVAQGGKLDWEELTAAAGSILLVSFAVAVVIDDRMWRRPPEDHPSLCQDAV